MTKRKKTKNKREKDTFIFDFMMFLLGFSLLIVGIRHYDFFGWDWKNILSIFLGIIFLAISWWDNKVK